MRARRLMRNLLLAQGLYEILLGHSTLFSPRAILSYINKNIIIAARRGGTKESNLLYTSRPANAEMKNLVSSRAAKHKIDSRARRMWLNK